MRIFFALVLALWLDRALAEALPAPLAPPPSANENEQGGATGRDLGSKLPGLMVQPGARARSLLDKLGDFKVADDYIQLRDDGDFAPAIERAAAAGVRALGLVDGRIYTLKRAVNLPNGAMSIKGFGPKAAEIRLAGSATTWFEVGNETSMSYNFALENILFTKETPSTSGAVVKATNLYLWSFSRIRVFGENKAWRVIDCVSCGELTSRDVKVEDVRAQAMYVTCGTAPPGNPGGQCLDLILDNWYTYGTNSASSDPATDGAFVFEDNFQAVRILNPTTGKHRGYAYRFNGTVANRANNALNFVVNPNVEASLETSGVAYFGAVASSQIGGSVSWVTGKGGSDGTVFAAIRMSPDTRNITVRGMQLGLAKPGAVGILDEGLANHVQDIEFVGYDGDADAAIVLAATASKGFYRGLKVSQLKRAIVDRSPDTAGHSIRDVAYSAISGTALSGLSGSPSGNKDIGGILNMDTDGSTLEASPILDLPDRGETFRISGKSRIESIVPTYLGRRVTLLLIDPGNTFIDLHGKSGAGSLYLSPAGPATFQTPRGRISFEWRGDYWWEIFRSG